MEQFYRFAILKKWVSDNTALQLEIPRLPDKEPAFLKVEQVQRLLAAAEKFGVLGYVLLAVFAGIRTDEVGRLDWADVHIDEAEHRFEKLSELVSFYGGQLLTGVVAEEPTEFASIIRFPDSFQVRARVSLLP